MIAARRRSSIFCYKKNRYLDLGLLPISALCMEMKTSETMAHINEIEGIGPSHAEKFESHDIKTVEDLLKAGATPTGREELVKKTGISHHLMLKWVDQADLLRVKGIGRQYAELLRAAGVDSIKELAQRRADHLHEKLTAINRDKKHVHDVPGINGIERWIEEAKALPRIVSY